MTPDKSEFVKRQTHGPRAISYFLAPPKSGVRPLVVVLQGSGCEAAFVEQDGGLVATAGQDIVRDLAAERFAVMIVEKPFVAERSADSAGQVSDECASEFRRSHTLDNWTSAISRAIDAAKRSGAVDRKAPVNLIGLSEGAVVAAHVAAKRLDVGHIAFISGFGCDQWSDMLVRARLDAMAGEGTFDEKTERARKAIAAVEAGFAAVASDPMNPDAYFEGQTHLFWSTFGRACPANDLAKSNAEVLVYYGTNDEQIDANGVEAITAARLAVRKPIRVERIHGGGHILNTSDEEPFKNLIAAFADALDWMTPAEKP